jgi:hypothetical protein
VLTLVGLVAWPIAWGYEQRRRARTWQSIACTYRIREAAVRAPVIAGGHSGRNPCQTLQRLGLTLEPPR